jgi:hypothetical protein
LTAVLLRRFSPYGHLEFVSGQRSAEGGATRFKKAARTEAAEPNDVITYAFHHFGNQVY